MSKKDSQKFNLLIERTAQTGVAIWFLGILATLCFYPPFWALMDDAGHVQKAMGGFESKTFLQWISAVIQGDLGWGMFRPIYDVFIYVFYGVFWRSSQLAYLVIYFINVAIFWFWSVLFRKITEPILLENKQDPQTYQWFFLTLCFLFTPHFNLIFFASPQERFILLFSAFAFLGISNMEERNGVSVSAILYLIGGVLLSLLSKATALFLIVPLVLWLLTLWNRERKSSFLWLSVILILIGIGFGFFFLSIRGGYTHQYRPGSVFSLFFKIGLRFHIFFWFGIISLTTLFLFFRKLGKKVIGKFFCLAIWPVSLLSILLVMLPWGSVAGYYLVPVGVFWIGSLLSLCALFRVTTGKKVFGLFGFILLLSIFAARSFYWQAKEHHGTFPVIERLQKEIDRLNPDDVMIRMPTPCREASFHLSNFLHRPGLVKELLDPNDPFLSQIKLHRFLVLNQDCPRVPESFFINKVIFFNPPWIIYEGEITA